jgi:hypothetical protein
VGRTIHKGNGKLTFEKSIPVKVFLKNSHERLELGYVWENNEFTYIEKNVVIPCRKGKSSNWAAVVYQAWSFSTGVKYLPDPAALIILTHSAQLLWRTLSNKSGHIGRPRVLCLSDLIKFVKSLDRVLQLFGLTPMRFGFMVHEYKSVKPRGRFSSTNAIRELFSRYHRVTSFVMFSRSWTNFFLSYIWWYCISDKPPIKKNYNQQFLLAKITLPYLNRNVRKVD